MISPAVLLLVGVSPAALVQGSDSIQLRFAPVLNGEIHRLFQSRTVVTITSGGDGHGADSVTRSVRESAALGGMRQVALQGVDGQAVLHLAFDSLSTRVRDDPGPWRELRVGGLDSLWVQVTVDDRMRLSAPRSRGDHPGLRLLQELAVGLPGLGLPSGWVHPGERWTQELDIPVGVFAARPASGLDTRVLTSRVTFALDSLVSRARDTLAYISLEGRFRAKVQRLPGDRFRRSTGSLRGTLVWSTGWDTFVSQVTRIEIHVGVAVSGVAGRRYIDEAALRTTVRAQVQASR